MQLAAGTSIGNYEILSAIGKGGMGEVYRARDTKLKRQVAIKSLPAEFSNEKIVIRFFLVGREWHRLAWKSSGNIPPIK